MKKTLFIFIMLVALEISYIKSADAEQKLVSDQKIFIVLDFYTGSYYELELVKLSLKKIITGLNSDAQTFCIVDNPGAKYRFYKVSYVFNHFPGSLEFFEKHFKIDLPNVQITIDYKKIIF